MDNRLFIIELVICAEFNQLISDRLNKMLTVKSLRLWYVTLIKLCISCVAYTKFQFVALHLLRPLEKFAHLCCSVYKLYHMDVLRLVNVR